MNETENLFQQKLFNHQIAIDDTFWLDMERRLNAKKHKKTLILWMCTGGVAASLALFLMLVPFRRSENISTISENTDMGSTSAKPVHNKANTAQTVVESRPTAVVTQVLTAKNDDVHTVLVEMSDTVLLAEAVNINLDSAKTEANVQSETPTDDEIARFEQQLLQEQTLLASAATKKREPLTVALATGFGYGNLNGKGENANFVDKSSRYNNVENALAQALNGNDVTLDEIMEYTPVENHLPPLSIGILFRKNINDRFAWETGLAYTCLRTTFDHSNSWDNTWVRDNAVMTQHYIGIPLNVAVHIVNSKIWNFYFSLGVMAEKGVWLKYSRQCTYSYTPEIYTQTLEQKIKGIQWSSGATIGTSYRINRNVSLYFEPKINRYFDCNQPRSFRTASPFNLGLNAGVRIDIPNRKSDS